MTEIYIEDEFVLEVDQDNEYLRILQEDDMKFVRVGVMTCWGVMMSTEVWYEEDIDSIVFRLDANKQYKQELKSFLAGKFK